MRYFSTLFLFFLSFQIPLMAQGLADVAAKNDYPGTVKVRLAEDQPFPLFVEFAPEIRLTVNEAIVWMKQNFALAESTTFTLIRTNEDKLGYSHHRFQQMENGHPVTGGIYILHSFQGRVQSMNGVIFNIESQSSVAAISSQTAIDRALAHIPASKYGWETTHGGGINRTLSEYPNPELVWVPEKLDKNGVFKLAYKMDVYALTPHHHRSWIYIDAQTGEVVAEENRICHTNIEGTAATVYSGVRPMWMDQTAPDNVRLRETFHGNGVITLDQQNLDQGQTDEAIDFTHPDAEWIDGTSQYTRYGADVHWATQKYHELLDSFFDRNSLNEEGLELIAYVHVGQNWANATWNGSFARFGDGNPGSGSLNMPLGTVDIVAHEFTHGLTDYTADLIYAYEAGALNESFSDIFGLALDKWVRPETFNWLIGTDATSDGDGIRSASDPNFHGHADTYQGENWTTSQGDIGGVHSNSAVQNHWYYLLSEGGTGTNDNGDDYAVVGIGWEKALAVAYRNLAFYLTPFSDYDDAMYYGNQSASELFGACSQEYFSTVNAWHAVGLGQPIGEPVPDFQAQRYHCEVGNEITFLNLTQPVVSVLWNFGDGATSTQNTPTHAYSAPGSYDVSLTVETCSGDTETIVREDYIIIDPDGLFCTAYIMDTVAVDTLTSCTGVILDPGGLNDYPENCNSVLVIDPPSLGPIFLTFTDFRLYTNQNQQDRLVIYDGPNTDSPQIGIYVGTGLISQTIQSSGGVITLEFRSDASVDNDGDPTVQRGFEIYYSIPEAVDVPVAGFDVNTSNPLLNAPVQFTDVSQYPGDYIYDFGDGTISNEANPVHQYTAPGTYTITQTIVNCLGTDVFTSELVVTEPGSLTLSPDSICVTINAGSQYSGEITFFNGGPGDLYYSAAADDVPSWLSYEAQSGALSNADSISIPIALDATNLVADTYTYHIPMQSGDTSQLNVAFLIKMIVLPFPQASITVDAVDVCNGLYQFTDETINEPTSWLWNFGDGNTSTEESPEFQYLEDGAYEVSMVACNDLGCDSVAWEELIVINYCDTLIINTTGDALMTNCNGILYDDGGPDGDYSNNVDFVTTIAPVGADFVTLTIRKLQSQPIFDLLKIYDGADTLAPLLATYSGFVGQGTQVTSTGETITIRFESNNVATFDGFEILWECGEGLVPPNASFVAEQDNDCNNTWYFEGFPGGNYAYTWDFGDGLITTTNLSNQVHHYTTTGNFTVSLNVTNAVGSSTYTEEVTVSSIPFDLDMSISADTVDLGEIVFGEAILDISPASYSWIISTGDTLTTADLSYMFTESGDQTIYLEVLDANGCAMWVEKEIFVTDITGINELAPDEVFVISPNPSNGQFNLSIKLNEPAALNIRIHNVLGQAVYVDELGVLDAVNREIQLNNLSGGMYFLSLYKKNEVLGVRPIVIQ